MAGGTTLSGRVTVGRGRSAPDGWGTAPESGSVASVGWRVAMDMRCPFWFVREGECPGAWGDVKDPQMHRAASLRPPPVVIRVWTDDLRHWIAFRLGRLSHSVMRGLDPRIPLGGAQCPPTRDGRDKPGHDGVHDTDSSPA